MTIVRSSTGNRISAWSSIASFIRWRDWGPGKLTLLFGLCLYLAVAENLSFTTFTPVLALFLLFAAAQSALGFVLNDWGDRELDRSQGKPNVFNDRLVKQGLLGLTLTLLAAAATGLPFAISSLRTADLWFGISTQPVFLPLWAVWVFVAAGYSLKPIRLKTRGAPGLIFSFFAQWSLPVFIAFAVFHQLDSLSMWAFAFAMTLSGITLEIGHQRHDRARDASTDAQTFAVRTPSTQLDRAYAVAILLDKVAVGIVTATVALGVAAGGEWWAIGMAVGIGIVYLGLFAVTLPGAWRALWGGPVQDPYYASGRSPAKLLHETLLNFALPIILALSITLRDPRYLILLLAFAVWRVILGGADWRWPFRFLKR